MLSSNGTLSLDSVVYMVDSRRAFDQVLTTTDGDKIIVTDTHGEVIAELTRPAPGIKYVGNRRPRGPRPRPSDASPMS